MPNYYQEHLSFIESIQTHIRENQQAVYQFLDHLIVKSKILDPFSSHHKQQIKYDFILLLIYICKMEFPYQLRTIITAKISGNENFNQRSNKILRVMNSIDTLIQSFEIFTNGFLRSDPSYSEEKELVKKLEEYKQNISQWYIKKPMDSITVKKQNYLYTQKISSITGARDLFARVLSVAIQTCFYEDYYSRKYMYVSIIYKILEYFFTDVGQQILTYNPMYKFIESDLYKLISEVDVRNPTQKYLSLYSKIYSSHNYEIEPTIIALKEKPLSYFLIIDFVNKKYRSYKDILSDDFKK